MNLAKAGLLAGVALVLLAGCSQPASGDKAADSTQTTTQTTQTAQATPPAPDVHPAPLDVPPIAPSASPLAAPLDQAAWSDAPLKGEAKRNQLIKVEVLLSRAHFSPGVIDGQDGDNLKDALKAFETAHGLTADGKLDSEVWGLLTQDTAPVVTDYVIAPADVAGPFVAKIPTKYEEMAKLDRLGFTSASEALAEKFHMDEALLKALNPKADFSAGSTIVVAAPGSEALPGKVVRIAVDKSTRQVQAFGEDGKLMASYPATVGSTDRPAPSGTWAVKGVARDPTWTYDPSRLTFGDKKLGKFTIKAGPNNPVGAVWIDLTKDTYGIHGTPDPKTVGKVASHGCVRMTNWDALQLAAAVKPGTKVEFVGEATPTKKTKL